MTKLSRELKAVTFDPASTSQILFNHDKISYPCNEPDVTNEDGLFNFQKWYSNNPLIYKPNFNSKYFSYGGCWFHWSTNQRTTISGRGYDRVIVLRCFGRSTTPIKNLLSDIKGSTLTQGNAKTEVYRSSVKSSAPDHQWLRQSVRPSRPMHTVCLDEDQKTTIVRDINEYLQPATASWYAERGIPYRRGYLFYGPPGTGKTSLSFAIAGVFGLSIYCISLGERTLTEADLATLFDNLPERCIVLLEDIDSAGVRRDADKVIMSVPDSYSDSGDDEDAGSLIKTKVTKHQRGRISLAGLLNIIDGVASKEVGFYPYHVERQLLTSNLRAGTSTYYDNKLS
jgi:chaperone BCS1